MHKNPNDLPFKNSNMIQGTVELPEIPGFVFSTKGNWIIDISQEGIKFNRKAFPSNGIDDFADAFIELLEKEFDVQFLKKGDIQKLSDVQWINIWDIEPPRNEEILFMTGDRNVHLGEIFSTEKLRKCAFHSFSDAKDYECDSLTPLEDRVIYWFPIPKEPDLYKNMHMN